MEAQLNRNICWVWLQGQTQSLIVQRLVKWVPGTSGEIEVKSKLTPRSGCVVLRQLNPIHK